MLNTDEDKRQRAVVRATQWNKDNPVRHNAATARWRKNNPEKHTAANRNWRKANPEKRQTQIDQVRERRQELSRLPLSDPRGRKFREDSMFHDAKKRAKKFGWEFNLDKEDVVIPLVCPVFGFPLTCTPGKGSNEASPSLDRIDNNKGYIKGNVLVVSLLANRIKSTADAAQLRIVADFYEAQAQKISSASL